MITNAEIKGISHVKQWLHKGYTASVSSTHNSLITYTLLLYFVIAFIFQCFPHMKTLFYVTGIVMYE